MSHLAAVALALMVVLSFSASPAGADDKHAGKHRQQHQQQHQKERQRAEHEYRKQLQKEQHEYSKDRQKAEHEYSKDRQRAEHEYGKRRQRAEHEHLKHTTARFGDRQRRRVAHYYRDHYGPGRGCPPGLRAHGAGCALPGPGKRYAVGRALPGDVSLYPLPGDLVARLSPPPPGFAYGFVDGDLVLYEVPTRLVIDVVVAPF